MRIRDVVSLVVPPSKLIGDLHCACALPVCGRWPCRVIPRIVAYPYLHPYPYLTFLVSYMSTPQFIPPSLRRRLAFYPPTHQISCFAQVRFAPNIPQPVLLAIRMQKERYVRRSYLSRHILICVFLGFWCYSSPRRPRHASFHTCAFRYVVASALDL